MIYLDHAATTPVAPDVAEAMISCLRADGDFANPSSVQHALGRAANQRVEQARGQVAAALNADAREIVFTSGATESDNLAILGAARFYAERKGRHLISSKIEHRAVVDAFKALEAEGFEVSWLEPGADGLIGADLVAAEIRSDTSLVSIMHVNNELGTINDVAAIAELCRDQGVIFHVDAAQSFGKVALDLAELSIDLLSISGHKIYGPKGVGVLFVRRNPRVWLTPLLFGGGQERGARPGTLATHQIVGLGMAAEIIHSHRQAMQVSISNLQQQFLNKLLSVEGVLINGCTESRLPNIVNFSVEGVNGEALLAGLPGLALATGSACSSAEREPSYVLKALGRSDKLAEASLRVSFGVTSTVEEVVLAAEQIVAEISRLRCLSPLWPAQKSSNEIASAALKTRSV